MCAMHWSGRSSHVKLQRDGGEARASAETRGWGKLGLLFLRERVVKKRVFGELKLEGIGIVLSSID